MYRVLKMQYQKLARDFFKCIFTKQNYIECVSIILMPNKMYEFSLCFFFHLILVSFCTNQMRNIIREEKKTIRLYKNVHRENK